MRQAAKTNDIALSSLDKSGRAQALAKAKDGSRGVNITETKAAAYDAKTPQGEIGHAHMHAASNFSAYSYPEKRLALGMVAGHSSKAIESGHQLEGSREKFSSIELAPTVHHQALTSTIILSPHGKEPATFSKPNRKGQASGHQAEILSLAASTPSDLATLKTDANSARKAWTAGFQRNGSPWAATSTDQAKATRTPFNSGNQASQATSDDADKINDKDLAHKYSMARGRFEPSEPRSSLHPPELCHGPRPVGHDDDEDHKPKPAHEAEAPKNIIIFIRDQVKPEDLWLPRDWGKSHLPNQQWLKDNGLSFSNACTNSAMCSAARSTFFTSKFPAQHEVKLVLSDIQNPILDVQTQLNPDLPNLATVLKGQGYDVGFIGKAHLSKTFTRNDGETVYQDLKAYGFDDWQGPDAGQDMETQNAGGGYADNDGNYTKQAVDWITNRASSDSSKPFCLVFSLINPHDVLSYPLTYKDFGYDESWLQGDIKDLPPTVNEILAKNYKPAVQTQWNIAQQFAQPLFTDQEKLNYINFYGNLMIDVDSKMGEILKALGKTDNPSTYSELLKDTMIVSTSDHGEMGLSHGGLVQKMEVAYDEALKVPMVWSNPEYFKGGQETDALVSHVDFLPTLVNFLGFDPAYIKAQDFRGVDYSKIVNYAHSHDNMAKAPNVQENLLYTYDDIYAGQDPALSANGDYVHGLFPAANRIEAIRSKDFKLVRYYSGDKAYIPANWDEEFYDLRKTGGDYYPDKDPITGELNIFNDAPLELVNLTPRADAQRVLDGKQAVASPFQVEAYRKMSLLLDQQIADRLDPLTKQPAVAPSIFVYQGGSMEGSVYQDGDQVSRLIQEQGSQTLELAFNTRTHQSYDIVYKSNAGAPATLLSGIVGTNGPVYEYLNGLPLGLNLADIGIKWEHGIVPLA